MRAGILRTPRPVPGRLLPAIGGALVLLLALPVFLIAGWRISGWALGAVLWLAMQAFGVLVAVAASDAHLAVAAALTYALAYTFELGLSLVTYFGGAR